MSDVKDESPETNYVFDESALTEFAKTYVPSWKLIDHRLSEIVVYNPNPPATSLKGWFYS